MKDPLEGLAKEQFEELLSPKEVQQFDSWKASARQTAWFFLDSVDELKLVQGKLEHALRHLRRAIEGNLHRAHVIVSSRPTDWRAAADEPLLRLWLPVPEVDEGIPSLAEDVFLEPLRRNGSSGSAVLKSATASKAEEVDTVLLLPLADRHIQQFAKQRGVTDCDALFREIGRSNAWIFARRPQDLLDLIGLWKTQGRLGTRREQHELNVSSKLKDSPGRPDAGVLSDHQASEGEKIALAMALTRSRAIKAPDQTSNADAAEAALDVSEILRDWTPEQRSALLRRAMFDPATFGRVRFHHRSVQEYLAARRLYALRCKGMSVKATFRLLFAGKYGEQVIIPSMRPIAAWLAIWDEDVSRETIGREPDVLLEHGDPGSLPIPVRQKIIRSFVNKHQTGGWRGFRFPAEQIERIACSELAHVITECWGDGPENPEVRELLLELIWKGSVSQCVSIARSAAFASDESDERRTMAIRALVACAASKQLKAIASRILSKPGGWPQRLISVVLPNFFPDYLTTSELVDLLARHQVESDDELNSSSGYQWSLRGIVNDDACLFDRAELRRLLTSLVISGTEQVPNWGPSHFSV